MRSEVDVTADIRVINEHVRGGIMRAVPVKEIEGVTDEIAEKLTELGITDSDRLAEAAATPAARKELSRHCGCETRVILQLANRADLARVKGIGGVYSDLLEIAGVDTVKELATRQPDNLHAKIVETNARDKLTTKPPTRETVADWVAQAKTLPKLLSY